MASPQADSAPEPEEDPEIDALRTAVRAGLDQLDAAERQEDPRGFMI